VIGTSRSTEATMILAAPLDGQVAGFVHASSMDGIAGFDPRKFRSRHLGRRGRRQDQGVDRGRPVAWQRK